MKIKVLKWDRTKYTLHTESNTTSPAYLLWRIFIYYINSLAKTEHKQNTTQGYTCGAITVELLKITITTTMKLMVPDLKSKVSYFERKENR